MMLPVRVVDSAVAVSPIVPENKKKRAIENGSLLVFQDSAYAMGSPPVMP
jgi:hypothetical protein